ncbi:MAG: DUF5378 domain-containing protein [Candidatus Ureaplasma intestinipullorum]|uniref:DUF5378 domain-containing protein n=1 Tax=Candidatus Ureaplasma intestinipullorum TaxID=2838770 RepID=A0A9E2KW04_9BACT|nr:DUF5378 domain-containing protein [Candidatus Ureaplasma intestinipullorum]
MNFGTILGILTLLLTIIALILATIFRIVSKLNLTIKYLKIFLGIFGLIYFIIFWYFHDLINIINNQNSIANISIYWSKVLLLDMCPFMYVFLNLCFIFDYKNKLIKTVCLWSIIGSSITIIGSIWSVNYNGNPLIYIFLGSNEGRLYYFIHAFMLIFGTFFFVYNNRHRFIDVFVSHLLPSLYLIYVLIIIRTLNITRNASGLVEYDWINTNGEYYLVYQLLKLKFPQIQIVAYFLVWIEMIILIILRNSIAKPTLQWFWPKFIYQKITLWDKISKKWYLTRLKTF